MTRNSLRLRLVAGGAATIVIALAISGAVLTLLFERHVLRTVAADLDIHLNQLLSGIDVGAGDKIVVNRPPTDPRFAEPLSGLYWQISSDDGQVLRSRSLWDAVLSLPASVAPSAGTQYYENPGPAGARVLIADRQVMLTIKGRPDAVRVVVATDLARVTAARAGFAADLAVALAVLGAILAAATSIQVSLGLRPLDALRRGVADIRSGRDLRLKSAVPREVQPLVEEVNALLDAREREIARSRNRAADLAHGLKTPLAALAADSNRLREKGDASIANEIDTAIDAMRRHVDRELVRTRLRGSVGRGQDVTTPLAPLVRALVATLTRTPEGRRVNFDVAVAGDVLAPIDRADLAEVMGNLLENATRHAKSQVRIVATTVPDGMSIAIEDDGRGIARDLQAAALARGVRLDERAGGTGLGLAIVQDVLDAYGWTLHLDHSELGGLKVSCRSPRQNDGAMPADAT
jgi:signal transduction histidine kinase